MSRANRHRRPARPVPFRDAKKRILVVCEGTTEKEYVDGYVRSLRNTLVVVEAIGNAGVPLTVVARAIAMKTSNARQARSERDSNILFDSVWVVFDIDEHPGVNEAKITARDNEIEVAVSNPCIELWLYLHFADSPGMQDRHRLLALVKERIPGYDKHIEFAEFVQGVTDAYDRAMRLDQEADLDKESGRNPTTSVWRLIGDILRGQS